VSPSEAKIEITGFALLCDAQGKIARVVGDGLRVTARLVPGQPFTALVHPECAGKALEFLRTLLERQAAFNWELTVPVDDGQLLALHIAGGKTEEGFLIVGAKSLAGVARTFEELAQSRDEQPGALGDALQNLSLRARAQVDAGVDYYDELTRLNNELATAQRELAKRNAELARLNEQKNQFLGIAAHDLRNPLNVILNYSQFIVDQSSDGLEPKQLEFVKRIMHSSAFMLNLVNDLLDVARIEAGKLELELERVDLREIVRRNVALNRTLAERKGIEIALAEGEGLPLLQVDVFKIEQVLNNLIENAIKFSPPQGRIDVQVDETEAGVTVSVRDQGEGLTGEELERLFRPFEKGRVKTTGGEKSTGLGLAIVKRIVEGHGGRIWAESLATGGAAFFFSLPAS
jgi:two-component system, OmpR family, sensor kinase